MATSSSNGFIVHTEDLNISSILHRQRTLHSTHSTWKSTGKTPHDMHLKSPVCSTSNKHTGGSEEKLEEELP